MESIYETYTVEAERVVHSALIGRAQTAGGDLEGNFFCSAKGRMRRERSHGQGIDATDIPSGTDFRWVGCVISRTAGRQVRARKQATYT